MYFISIFLPKRRQEQQEIVSFKLEYYRILKQHWGVIRGRCRMGTGVSSRNTFSAVLISQMLAFRIRIFSSINNRTQYQGSHLAVTAVGTDWLHKFFLLVIASLIPDYSQDTCPSTHILKNVKFLKYISHMHRRCVQICQQMHVSFLMNNCNFSYLYCQAKNMKYCLIVQGVSIERYSDQEQNFNLIWSRKSTNLF